MDERGFHDRFYGGEAERIFSSRLYRALLDLHVEFLLGVSPNLAGARVLSIGCGDGRRELAMARHAGHVLGLDLSPVAIENARLLAERAEIRNVEFRVDDAGELGRRFPDHFDVIYCLGVLHHLSEPQTLELLRSARSALKPAGCLVSMDPNAYRAVNLFKPLFRRAYDRYHSPDERELRPADVVEKMRATGFTGITVRFTDWFISPLAWLSPHLASRFAPGLVRLDQLLVRTPFLKELSSGFAVVARRPP